ncbi:hypothetical protein P691DRAFT_526254 [Macrolepiota fuliginosa MF-IS2]|uniref:Ankyrin n=1 Tax=Macrolepiota fuliginosa MF-IS2 TaxID=1400762 RepID=A0A9P5XRE7_9AGAR|nr:hypothetical protein P691DRAFT_526254 [Macrolepiota fuliginosa MF-IS2]
MPVPLRATHHRAEARYNVTTDFPSLGLHSAASTGNVGLVEYALSRGQPVNSVVDGVLPLHAACAGGNVQVVKLLIEYGADVNAPRLPKRYSNRDSSAPIIGTTGSTPLHFAAANGNRDAIMLLLLHGAHADRPDKHGVTPEALSRQNGWVECADLLREWIINKDKDLRDREEFVAADDKHRGRLGSFGDTEPSHTSRRRLHVKHSFDTAFNILKSSSPNLTEIYNRGSHTPTPPTSPSRPFGDFTPALETSNEQFPEPSTRRPSLPQVMQIDSFSRPRKGSAQSTNMHRPRSAGEGAEKSGPVIPSSGKGGTARRLGSKVSLLNLFRKGQSSEGTSTPETNVYPATSDIVSLSTSPPNAVPPHSSTPLPIQRSRFHQDSDASIRSKTPGDGSLERKPSLNSPSRSPIPLPVDLHNALTQEQQRINNRDRSRSNASRYEYLNDDSVAPAVGSYHSPGSSPLARLGLLRNQHHRTRSGSGSSLSYEVNVPSRLGIASTTVVDDLPDNNKTGVTGADTDNVSRSLPRSSILRPHNRNGSNGQGHMTPSALRALRFDTLSSTTHDNDAHGDLDSHSRDAISHSPSPRSTPAKLKSSNSVGSLTRPDPHGSPRTNRRPGSAGSMPGQKLDDGEGDVPIEEKDEYYEEEYGKPIEITETPSLFGVGKPDSAGASLSPIISNDHTRRESEDALAAEFPFSINRPPPIPAEGDVDEIGVPPPMPSSGRTIASVAEARHRGDSLSSAGTIDSQGQTSSAASTMILATPLMTSEVVPPPDRKGVLTSGPEAIDTEDEDQSSQYVVISPATDISPSPPYLPRVVPRRPPPLPLQPQSYPAHTPSKSGSSLAPPTSMHSSSGGMNGRRTHTPFGIDITSISTHAQAEALVEKARKDVMELASQEEQDPDSETGSEDRTPLSARLAAYGESLALERRFRELEKGGGSAASGLTISTTTTNGERSATGVSLASLILPVMHQHSREGSGYAGSLYSGKSTGDMKDTSPRPIGEVARGYVQRPSTAEGCKCTFQLPMQFPDKYMQWPHETRICHCRASSLISHISLQGPLLHSVIDPM